MLDHATSEIASGSKLGVDAIKKMAGEGSKRAWPPLIKMDAAVKAKMDSGQLGHTKHIFAPLPPTCPPLPIASPFPSMVRDTRRGRIDVAATPG